MTERDVDQLDLTERMPPSWDPDELELDTPANRRDDSHVSPLPLPAAPPAPARATASHRVPAPARTGAAPTVPPPIPAAARVVRRATLPPPIPAAVRANRRPTVPPPIPTAPSASPPIPSSVPLAVAVAARAARPSVPPPIPPRALARSSGVVAAVQPQVASALARSSDIVAAVQPQAIERDSLGSEESIDIDLTPLFAKRELTPPPIAAVAPPLAEPTPSPRPTVERESEAWLDAQPGVATSSEWNGTAHVARTATQVPILRLALVAVLFGGLSAMTVILLRGDHARQRAGSAAVVSTPAVAVDTPAVEPAALAAPTVTVEPLSPSVETPSTPQSAQETTAPPVADEPQIAAAEPAQETTAPPVTDEPQIAAADPAQAEPTANAIGEPPVVAEEPRVAAAEPDAPRTAERGKKKRRHGTRQDRTARESTARRETTVAAASAQAGEGTLMISSKPPCEIAIDGVATMLTTPQRAIKLRAGKHKVTLFNLEHRIDKTFEIVIKPRKATKLIHDFMAKK